MIRKLSAIAIVLPCFYLGLMTISRAVPGQDADAGKLMTDLAGKWEIIYTNGALRVYVINKADLVVFDNETPKLQTRIERKGEALLVMFNNDIKLERLTMGVDGRLFVEHFNDRMDYIGKHPGAIGIGIRQN